MPVRFEPQMVFEGVNGVRPHEAVHIHTQAALQFLNYGRPFGWAISPFPAGCERRVRLLPSGVLVGNNAVDGSRKDLL